MSMERKISQNAGMDGYGELCTRFYDLDKPKAPELALDWFARELAGCVSVLEPMCGSGRFLVPLVRQGLLVDGVDPSQSMWDDWPKETTRTVTDGGLQIRLASRVEYDPAKQVETHTNLYELKRSGRVVRVEHEILRLRCYGPDEMRAELERAGFGGVTIEHPEFGWVARAQ
jgi:hypothetical protein